MSRPVVTGKWPKAGVTFDVRRGSFLVPAAVLARADVTGDDYEIRRAFARALAHDDEARPYRYVRSKDGLRVYWRSIRVVSFDPNVDAASRHAVDVDPAFRQRRQEFRRNAPVTL